MTSEDNYSSSLMSKTKEEWVAEGYTTAYASVLARKFSELKSIRNERAQANAVRDLAKNIERF
tara:strand:- start:334 stop:522 length:189 start_codon:yes stop_codon:yes gene_type:complete